MSSNHGNDSQPIQPELDELPAIDGEINVNRWAVTGESLPPSSPEPLDESPDYQDDLEAANL